MLHLYSYGASVFANTFVKNIRLKYPASHRNTKLCISNFWVKLVGEYSPNSENIQRMFGKYSYSENIEMGIHENTIWG